MFGFVGVLCDIVMGCVVYVGDFLCDKFVLCDCGCCDVVWECIYCEFFVWRMCGCMIILC